MTHYQEVRRENAERRLALGLSGDGTLEGTMNPFCGALTGEMRALAAFVDCPGCKALLLLRRVRQQDFDGRLCAADIGELLVALGDAP